MSIFTDLAAINGSIRNQQQPPAGQALPSYMYNLNFPPIGDRAGASQAQQTDQTQQPPVATPVPQNPQTGTMQQLQGPQGGGGMLANAAKVALMGGMCCFIFIEANGGTLNPVVRRYRDEHMNERNRRGYYRLADKLVPLMQKYKIIYHATRFLMTEPMTCYGKYFYGLNRAGKMFKPLAKFWLGVFNRLGYGKYTRSNGEVI